VTVPPSTPGSTASRSPRTVWGSAALRLASEPFGRAGRIVVHSVGGAGQATLFLAHAASRLPRRPLRLQAFIEQIYFIGSRSLVIVTLTSAFTGLVLALQGYTALERFGAEHMVGALVALSLTRELAPVLAAVMITARAGSAMAATLGNMRITEQIDALETMAIDAVDYLVKPRLAAAVISGPALTAVFTLVGLGVAQLFTSLVLGMPAGRFESSVRDSMRWSDINEGLVKSLVFSLLLVWIATLRGYHASGGAKGVGQATTRAVVESCVLILAVDYALTALLF
jgi:phospholipid/cholesterol/gamma-HCH transport system permease protein